jgi:hypothetical protein
VRLLPISISDLEFLKYDLRRPPSVEVRPPPSAAEAWLPILIEQNTRVCCSLCASADVFLFLPIGS